jgi:hypothetical protein
MPSDNTKTPIDVNPVSYKQAEMIETPAQGICDTCHKSIFSMKHPDWMSCHCVATYVKLEEEKNKPKQQEPEVDPYMYYGCC